MGTKTNSETATTDQEISESHKVPIWFFWRARRYILVLLIFAGFCNSYALRVNLSVAIVAMTQLNNVTLSNGTIQLHREFDWDTKLQGFLLSSFFYGYIFTQIIGGYLSIKFGGKVMFAGGIGIASILTIISPFAAKINVYLFLAVRILVGVFEGTIVPSLHYIYARWYPPIEKNRLVSIGLSGTYFGTVVSLPLSSLLATSFGWESIFYFCGIVGCMWTVLWLIIVNDTPSESRSITKEELVYITESLKVTNLAKQKSNIPWSKIFSSKHVWAASIGVTCEIWGYYTLLTQLPKFMKYCLNFDLNGAGAMSALPSIAVTITLQSAGYLADYISSKKHFTVTQIRKAFIGVGFMGQSIFLILSVYWLSKVGTIFCLIIAVGFGGIAMSAFSVNALDLSPNNAPVIVAIANTLATVPGIVSPIMTGYIVTDESNVEEWRIIFYITAGMYLFGSIIYLCFGSGELQPWNNQEERYGITSNNEPSRLGGRDNKSFKAEEM